MKPKKSIIPEFKISMKYRGKQSELTIVKDSREVAAVARQCFDSDQLEWTESFLVVALNQSNKVVGFYKVSSGGVTGTVADPKVIFQFALLSNASHLILAHNHPSGNLKPSKADEELTYKLTSAGRLLDIKIIDHVIVTSEGYFSFADEGLM